MPTKPGGLDLYNAMYALAAKAPFGGIVTGVAKVVESLPMPAQIALAGLITTPGLIVKLPGVIADIGTGIVDVLGSVFGSGYTQAELDRNHALVMAGMTPQPKDPGPGRRTIVP